jgi:hypothetical protein
MVELERQNKAIRQEVDVRSKVFVEPSFRCEKIKSSIV